jgi:signal transduction histidine kinase
MNRHLPAVTLAWMLLAAVVVLGVGLRASRQVVVERTAVDTLGLARFAVEAQRQLQTLDQRYQTRLFDLAGALDFGNENSVKRDYNTVTGVLRASRFLVGEGQRRASHVEVDYLAELARTPRFSIQERPPRGEVVFPAQALRKGMADGGWVEESGKPMAFWRRTDPQTLVVLTVFPAALQAAYRPLLRGKLPEFTRSLSGPPDHHRWSGPDGVAISMLALSESLAGVPPDRVFPLRSRFGIWTLENLDGRAARVTYGPAGVAAALFGGITLVLLGWQVFDRQRSAARLAMQRVSFVNQVSHELRTPLTNMMLNLDLVEEQLPEEAAPSRARLDLVRLEAGRLARLIDNVLTFSRADLGRLRLTIQNLNAAPLILNTAAAFRPLLERRGVTLETEVPERLDVDADADALVQIIANLLSNVEKHGAGSPARLSAVGEGGWLRLQVEDSGPGIQESFRNRVFQPFERASLEVSEGSSGAGLGLSIARDLARKMEFVG